MNQPNLFDVPPKAMSESAPYSNKTTSKKAAKKIKHKLAGKREQVYHYIKSQGICGATGSEIAQGCDMLLYTAKPRCTELRDAEYIEDSGTTRENENGSDEIVWVVKGMKS